MEFSHTLLVLLLPTLAWGQRPSFAGTRPIGFPELPNRTTTNADGLLDRFGTDGTTERLPIEALGDRDLIDRISKLPVEQQLFWYLNWKALEEQRKNPQTYPQRPSTFVESFPNSASNVNTATNNAPGTGFRNSETLGNFNSGNPNSVIENRNDVNSNDNNNNNKQGAFSNKSPNKKQHNVQPLPN